MVRIIKWLIGLAVLSVAGALIAAAVIYFAIMPGLPDVTELKRVDWQMPLSVYSKDGKFIAEFGETRRSPVSIDDVPAQTKNAVIAVEDAHFYKHIGVDWRGIARAVWLTATTQDERVPGGSTITQQVARNFFLTNEYSYFRKFKEMLLALHDVLKRAELFTGHSIRREALSVRQRMTDVLTRLGDGSFHRFESLFDPREGKLGVVVTFLAILELAKEQLLDIVQEGALAPIYLKSLAVRENGELVVPALSSEFDDDAIESAAPLAAANDDAQA